MIESKVEFKEESNESSKGFHRQLCEIIERDDEEKFVEMLNGELKKLETLMEMYLDRIICFNAIKCAKALFLLHPKVELSRHFHFSKLTPLHKAAACGHVELVDLFLRCDAKTALLRCDCEGEEYHHMLPINLVLDLIRKSDYLRDWSLEESVFKLLFSLCLPGLRARLKVVKLLALYTEGIEEEIFYYATQGKLVELTVLLMVAREKILSPTFFEKLSSSSHSDSAPEGSMSLRDFINTELTIITALEGKNMLYRGEQYRTLIRLCKEKQALRKYTLQLLEVFETAGHMMETYLQLQEIGDLKDEVVEGVVGNVDFPINQAAKEVARIFKEAGFRVKCREINLSAIHRRCLPGEFDWSGTISHDTLPQISGPQSLDSILHNGSNLFNLQHHEQRLQKAVNYGVASYHTQANPKENSATETPYVESKTIVAEYLYEPKVFVFQSFKTMQDLRTSFIDVDGSKFDGLRKGLESLCSHRYLKDWTPRKSLFKLFYILRAPELKESLNKLKSLVCNTKDIGELACYYIKEGKIVELAALLMVAWEKFDVSRLESNGVSGERMLIRQCIMTEIHYLFDLEIRSFSRCQGHRLLQCKNRLEKMLLALQVLEVSERSGGMIDLFCQTALCQRMMRSKEEMAEHLAYIFDGLGFALKTSDVYCDDLKYYSVGLTRKESGEFNRQLQKAIGRKFGSQLHTSSIPEKNPPIVMTKGNRWMSTLSYRHALPSFCSNNRSIHTYQSTRTIFGLHLSCPMAVEADLTTKHFESWISNFLSSKKLGAVALAISRAAKHV